MQSLFRKQVDASWWSTDVSAVRRLVHCPLCGTRINDDRVTKLSLHHPTS